ncbi:MAG: HDOD domain-containing protein [Deltaproteobacteria bacterium]|nr:HDOD domain-containing protein [Deltaproteobacteria bacterium]
MNETNLRVIFEGLDQNAQLRKLVLFFQKELGLSEDKIRSLLTSPPRVLWHLSNHNDGKLICEALKKMGCQTYLEPLIAHNSYPFAISQSHHKIIKQELSKVLRVKANLVLFLAQVEPFTPEVVIPSIMGDYEKKFGEYFRESDTVIGLDDSRLIILGFSTDSKGVQYVKSKANYALEKIFGSKIRVSIGFSLFPQETQSLQGLLNIAEQKRKNDRNPDASETDTVNQQEKGLPAVSVPTSLASKSLRQCIAQARGKTFQRLLNMDPQVLWLGLYQLPQTEQRQFSARLPFDSPLTSVLEEMIDLQHEPVPDKAAERHLEAIVHHMELEGGGVSEREEWKQQVLSKLKHAEALPTLPSIAAHIFKIASDVNSSAQDLTQVIANDPPITSKLLKIVNSAFYGFPQKIGTIKQAVVILGTEEIMDLAFGLAAAKAFRIKPIEGLEDPKLLWQHSMGTAFIAQNLCKKLPEYQNLGAFTAGLLHDFGRIFLIDNYPEPYGQVCLDSAKNSTPLFELEEERFGLSHAHIGQILASDWNLPEALVEAIAFHHQPFLTPTHSQFAAIIGLSDYLQYQATQQLDCPEAQTTHRPQLTFGHWKALKQVFNNLNTEKLEEMIQEAGTVLEESSGLFTMLGII